MSEKKSKARWLSPKELAAEHPNVYKTFWGDVAPRESPPVRSDFKTVQEYWQAMGKHLKKNATMAT